MSPATNTCSARPTGINPLPQLRGTVVTLLLLLLLFFSARSQLYCFFASRNTAPRCLHRTKAGGRVSACSRTCTRGISKAVSDDSLASAAPFELWADFNACATHLHCFYAPVKASPVLVETFSMINVASVPEPPALSSSAAALLSVRFTTPRHDYYSSQPMVPPPPPIFAEHMAN